MLGLNSSQIGALIERVATVVFTSAVGAGYVAEGDDKFYIAIATAVVSGVIGLINNRRTRLADRAAKANPDTVTIAPDTLAHGTKSANIVSSREYELTRK